MKFFNLSKRISLRIKYLKNIESVLFFLSGIMLVLGLYLPDVNFVFYLAFIYPAYKISKSEIVEASLFYFLIPYFLSQGIEVWNYLFPYYTGIVLSIALLDLVALLLYLIISGLKNSLISLPLALFIFDVFFQELPYISRMSMIPILSPIANHTFILRSSMLFGSHTLLFILLFLICYLVILYKKHDYLYYLIFITLLSVFIGGNIIITSLNNGNVGTVKVASIQGVIPFEKKYSEGEYVEYSEYVINYYKRIINNVDADIFVFPEKFAAVFDSSKDFSQENLKALVDFAKDRNAISVFVVKKYNKDNNTKDNRGITGIIISPNGVIGTSDKRYLVPFSEDSVYNGGNNYETITTDLGNIGISICYDTNYDTVSRLKQNGAELIVAPFNDYGFGSVYHRVHSYYSIIKAIENNISIAVANYDGISQIINHDGTIKSRLESNEPGVITETIGVQNFYSGYLYIGKYIEITFFGLSLSGLLYIASKKVIR